MSAVPGDKAERVSVSLTVPNVRELNPIKLWNEARPASMHLVTVGQLPYKKSAA